MKFTIGDEKDNALFCYAYYQEGNISEFIRELDDIEKSIRIIAKSKDKEYNKIVGLAITKISMIETLLRGKKIEENRQDLVDLGVYIQKIGKELEEFGKTNKSSDSEDKKNSDEEIADKTEEIIDRIVNDIKELMKN